MKVCTMIKNFRFIFRMPNITAIYAACKLIAKNLFTRALMSYISDRMLAIFQICSQ